MRLTFAAALLLGSGCGPPDLLEFPSWEFTCVGVEDRGAITAELLFRAYDPEEGDYTAPGGTWTEVFEEHAQSASVRTTAVQDERTLYLQLSPDEGQTIYARLEMNEDYDQGQGACGWWEDDDFFLENLGEFLGMREDEALVERVEQAFEYGTMMGAAGLQRR